MLVKHESVEVGTSFDLVAGCADPDRSRLTWIDEDHDRARRRIHSMDREDAGPVHVRCVLVRAPPALASTRTQRSRLVAAPTLVPGRRIAQSRSARLFDEQRMSHPERHRTQRIGWLRAAVLGANDGIVSTASLIVGVAAAEASRGNVVIAGVAGLVAGAMSMAAGEYVSVSSQADTERADLKREREELASDGEAELAELAGIYVNRGLDASLARQVAEQLTAHDALAHTLAMSWESRRFTPPGRCRPHWPRPARSRSVRRCPW